ncbi:ankyrin repeat domain-containing protein [Candidatus Dependentiae bacterium]|nr:ankyrin repeat domain-containing protein [Candidatus Dependentiae bacterium]
MLKKLFFLLIISMVTNLLAMEGRKPSPGKEEEEESVEIKYPERKPIPASIRHEVMSYLGPLKLDQKTIGSLVRNYEHYLQARATAPQSVKSHLTNHYRNFLLNSLIDEDYKSLNEYIVKSSKLQELPNHLILLIRLLGMLGKLNNALMGVSGLGTNIDLLKLILKYGGDIESKYADLTPLMSASFSGNITMAQSLLDSGANINAQNNSGTTALMVAASMGRKDIVKLLIDAKARINIADISGLTALDYAQIPKHNKDIIQLLKSKGAKSGHA